MAGAASAQIQSSPVHGRRALAPVDSSIGTTIDSNTIPAAERFVLAVLQGVSIYNAVELFFIILFTFRRRRGLYFWSMIAANVGVLVNATAFVVNDFGLSRHQLVPAVLIIVGWIPMTTGQAFVLYSRLHLLYVNPRVLRPVFVMIVADAVLGHLPTAVVLIGANSPGPARFLVPYSVYEKIEVTLFFLQETVLSGLYLWRCLRFWQHQRLREAGRLRNIILHLVAVNLLIVALDITILGLEYSGLYLLQTSYKAFVYSVKLKIEIGILNRLVDFVRATRGVEFHDRAAKDLEREWADTLQRAFAVNQSAVLGGSGGASVVPSLPKAAHVLAPGLGQEC
ncbi:hypothetical protein RB595_010265 [Gaeumannomyces hyphopodioides]